MYFMHELYLNKIGPGDRKRTAKCPVPFGERFITIGKLFITNGKRFD